MALIAHRVRTPRLAAGPAGFTNRSLVRAYCKSGRDPYASPMALLGKARTATGAGVIITVLLVLVFGSGWAAFATAFMGAGTSGLAACGSAAAGSAYGLFVGWVVGAGVAAGRGGS